LLCRKWGKSGFSFRGERGPGGVEISGILTVRGAARPSGRNNYGPRPRFLGPNCQKRGPGTPGNPQIFSFFPILRWKLGKKKKKNGTAGQATPPDFGLGTGRFQIGKFLSKLTFFGGWIGHQKPGPESQGNPHGSTIHNMIYPPGCLSSAREGEKGFRGGGGGDL